MPARLVARASSLPTLTILPVVEDRNPVARALDFRKQVGIDEDRLAAPLLGKDNVPDLLGADGVKPGRRLVQQQHIRVMHERLGDPDTLEHPLGVFAQRAVRRRRKAQQLQIAAGALLAHIPGKAVKLPEKSRNSWPFRKPCSRIFSGRYPIFFLAAGFPAGLPKTLTAPAVGKTSPSRILINVVFPAPLGPRKPKTSPSFTARSTPARARTLG